MKKNTVEIEQNKLAVEQIAYEIPAGGLYTLFAKRLSHANKLSPLASMKPAAASSAKDLDQIMKSSGFALLEESLLQPDLRIEHRYGGQYTGLTVFSTFKRDDSEITLVVFPQKDGGMILRIYHTLEEYLDWWSALLLSRVNNATANFLTPPLSIAGLIYSLHAIDCYRRYSYKTSLEYEPESTPFISCTEFNSTIAKSIPSFDLRWLLSSLFVLTPDLEGINFEPEEKDLSELVRRTILYPAKDEQGESLFYFGEAGQYLGEEFLRAWEISIGLSARRIINGAVRSVYRAFIAPTALSNHLFQFESDSKGLCVNHQPLGFDSILQMLENRVKKLPVDSHASAETPTEKNVESKEASQQGSRRQTDTTPTSSKLCRACGAHSAATMNFCGNCGEKFEVTITEKKNRVISKTEFEKMAARLQSAHENNTIGEKEFKSLHLHFKARSADGILWTVGLKRHDWYKELDGHWQKESAPEELILDDEFETRFAFLK